MSIDAALSWWPTVLGTPLQAGMLAAFLTMALRVSPSWLTTWSALRIAKSNANATRINKLEEALQKCREECAAEVAELNNKIQGLREQRNQEQLVMMRAIVRMSGDPDAKRHLEMLEAMEFSLEQAKQNSNGGAKREVDNEGA